MPSDPRPHQPATGGVRRAIVSAVAASFALTAFTVGAAAITLTGAEPEPVAAAPAPTTTSEPTTAPDLADPVQDRDARRVEPVVAPVVDGIARVEDIPAPALAAYQRAESVLARADRRCHLRWTVLAAIGEVVSHHGERGDRRVTPAGVVRPALVGKVVRNDAGKPLTDTDAGRLDGDKARDRAVGPMLLAPTTWSVVGVDGDGDGARNPQDVDDAALAVAVLMCAGKENLARQPGLRAAVQKVNASPAFVRTVLRVEADFRAQLTARPDLVEVDPTTDRSDPPADLPTVPSTDPTDDSGSDPSQEPSDPVTLLPGDEKDNASPLPDSSPSPTDPSTDPSPEPTEPTDPCSTDPTEDPSEPTPTDQPTEESTEESTEDPDDPCGTKTDEPTDDPTTSPSVD